MEKNIQKEIDMWQGIKDLIAEAGEKGFAKGCAESCRKYLNMEAGLEGYLVKAKIVKKMILRNHV